MATFKIYKLHFTSPLHISDQHADIGVSQKTIHSDTLYAALMSCLAKTGCSIPKDGNLGFVLSSMFPYYQEAPDSAPIYFLPVPMKVTLPELKDVAMAKKVKKVQWIDAGLYGYALSGKDFFDKSEDYVSKIKGAYLTLRNLPHDEFVCSEVAQRVRVEDRTGRSDALPYYVDRVLFKDFSGFYFLADGDTEMLDKALNILAEEGIGTDRNVGFGFFEYTHDTLDLDLPSEAEYMVTLSMFIPETESNMSKLLDSDKIAYELCRRGGWITTPGYMTVRKNAIYAFMPGSVFKKPENLDGTCIGKMVDLRPDVGSMSPTHPIWRCGKSIVLPIKL